ncbi:hypothetical protein HS99_0033555 [Kitasatospora aureofaciens]|uniref:Uncharacterized protein n=1 Tax=Kitasatospora aureofaciens TaxID=1894 RepID=A0A1E7N3G9_KITAU|nr:hypothetical protein B6264_10590 [Kitasatospora aureofaciens]OEV35241.1 hypothetical protein HS99_0033555 [Kitasatospora aureofaciens]QEV00505.1 hypothetical protein CP971_15565 [Streptomyces viridifaciens]
MQLAAEEFERDARSALPVEQGVGHHLGEDEARRVRVQAHGMEQVPEESADRPDHPGKGRRGQVEPELGGERAPGGTEPWKAHGFLQP